MAYFKIGIKIFFFDFFLGLGLKKGVIKGYLKD